MILDLERRLQAFAWVGQGRCGGQKDEFCAIFYRRSRLSLVDSGHFSLSEDSEQFGQKSWGSAYPRMCTWARFQLHDDPFRSFAVFNTHLDVSGSEARVRGIRLILDRIRQMRENWTVSVVLTGDFNANPSDEAVRSVEAAGLVHTYTDPSAAGCTYHSFAGGSEGEPIDYIFTTPDLRTVTVNVNRGQEFGRFPSDHYPVTAVLRFR